MTDTEDVDDGFGKKKMSRRVMEGGKIGMIAGVSRRIIYNIDYSMSKAKLRFPLLAVIFFAGILLLFLVSSWYSITSTRRSLYGASIVGHLNYASFQPDVLVTTMSYWLSSEYSLGDKVTYTLTTPVVIFGSHDQNTGIHEATFMLDMGKLINIISMSILLSLYTNMWLLIRKSACKIHKASQGTGMIGGTAGVSSVIVSMLLMTGCCGGTGIAFLLFGLPFIGSVFSNFYSNTDTYSLMLIAIPAFIVNFVGLMYLLSRRLSPQQEENKSRKNAVDSSWLKAALYLIASAIFISAFVMGLYWWQEQSNVARGSGITGGTQNITIVMFSSLPLSSSLFLVSALVQIDKNAGRKKPLTRPTVKV